MENKETPQWQNEIARLNSIIDALIAENRLLKAEIAFHKNKTGNPDAVIPFHNMSKPLPDAGIPYDKNIPGNPDVKIPYDKNMVGNTDIEIPYDKIKEGNPDSSIPYDKIMTGNPTDKIPHDNIMVGNPDAKIPYDNNMVGNPNVRIGNGKVLTPGLQHQRIVAKHLDKVLHVRTPKRGKRHAALLLLHFYNSNRGAHAELRKVTGLSIGGLTKQLVLFKQRGWLVKDGWQQFKLTDAARKIVEEGVWGNNPMTS
jgi:hypothetical protein